MVPSVWRRGRFGEGGGRSIRAEEITKDLPLEPILVALNGDHLSDLKLADPDLRTPARMDFLLGAEVFTSILRDGRRNGPRGTPFALNACFGWVLFGKIHGRRDVVDVANHTVEQLVRIDESEARRPYATVLTAGKNKDFRCTGRRKKRIDGGKNLKFRDGNIFSNNVEFGVKDSTEPGSRKKGERIGLHPEDAGKPRVFGRRDVGARTPLNERS